jgi:predicted RNA-binding Zn-ribbon protein involved in translation (DUF1610 family)
MKRYHPEVYLYRCRDCGWPSTDKNHREEHAKDSGHRYKCESLLYRAEIYEIAKEKRAVEEGAASSPKSSA